MNPEKLNTEGKVKIWTFDLDVSAADEKKYTVVLNRPELERASRFHFERHKRRFIAGRGILRMILAQYLECDPVTLCFTYSKFGKPAVLGPDGKPEINFSSTNSSNLGAVAISRKAKLGFDLEKVQSKKGDQMLIVENQFCDEEIDWFKSLPEDERVNAFFELWTGKEAYLKAKGLGMSVPLNSFYISIKKQITRLVWSDIDQADPSSWMMYRPVTQSGFTSCLAVQSHNCSVISEHWSL